MTTHSRLYRGDASGQPQHKAGRIDISRQVRQARGMVAWSFMSGVSFSVSGVLGLTAYVTTHDPVPSVVIASAFGLAGAALGAYAVALSGSLLNYVRTGEVMIEVLNADLKRLRIDNIRLHLRRAYESGVRPEGAVPGDTSDASGGLSRSSPGTVIPINGKTVRRFPS